MEPKEFGRVAVLMGGTSNERDISLPGKITLFNNDSKFLLDEKILINSIGNNELFLN